MVRKIFRALSRDHSGFGLIELIVAVAILAIISLALVPLMSNGLKQSSSNTTLATATQLANQQIATAATQPTTCANFNNNGILGTTTKIDPRGVKLVITNTVGACPSGFPSSRVFTSTVTRQDTGATLIAATTLVLVSGS